MTPRKIKMELVLSILALAVGITALFFSWEANRIASRSISADVKLLEVNFDALGKVEVNPSLYRLWCVNSLRVANLGGVQAIITDYQFYYSLRNYKRHPESDMLDFNLIRGVKFSENLSFLASFPLLPDKVDIYIKEPLDPILDPSKYTGNEEFMPYNDQFMTYIDRVPIKVQANDMVDIPMVTWFTFAEDSSHFEPLNFMKPGFEPFELYAELYLSTGEVLTSPTFTCYYIDPNVISNE